MMYTLVFVQSDGPFIDLCYHDNITNTITCNGTHKDPLPPLGNLTPVNNYSFYNFREIQPDAFHNMPFLENASITMHFKNFSIIHSNAFSSLLKLPANSNLSIVIENDEDHADLFIGNDAFNNTRIHKLHFRHIGSFNKTLTFNTRIFSDNITIDSLAIQHSDITGFVSDNRRFHPTITNLHIKHCSSLKRLTKNNLPAIPNTKVLEISDTGLESIEENAFEGWTYVLSELRIRNNKNLQTLPMIVAGDFFLLKTLDLSGNAIKSLDRNYDWTKFYTTENLILSNQPQLDLFLQSNILTKLTQLKTIDFSHSQILTSDTNFIPTYVPSMPLLISANISYTNFTHEMVAQFLNKISASANQTVYVETLGYRMNDTYFCSFYDVFHNAPNSIRIEFDRKQQCNCIIDLFYNELFYSTLMNDSLPDPICVYNETRERCDTQNQLTLSGCTAPNPNTDSNNSGLFGSIGPYAFAGMMGALVVVLIVLLAAGSSFIYKTQRSRRRGTMLFMDDPYDTQSIIYVEDRDDTPNESSTDIASSTVVEQHETVAKNTTNNVETTANDTSLQSSYL